MANVNKSKWEESLNLLRTGHEDKTNNRQPTKAEKEDATDSTVTTVTTTTTSHCEMENKPTEMDGIITEEVEAWDDFYVGRRWPPIPQGTMYSRQWEKNSETYMTVEY